MTGNDSLRIAYRFPVFPDITIQKGGFLPNVKAAHACWYFYILAEVTRQKVGDSIDDQIILEGEPWMDTHYQEQAISICRIYELDSPDDFAHFWPYVDKQIAKMGLSPTSPKYTRLMPKRAKLIVPSQYN